MNASSTFLVSAFRGQEFFSQAQPLVQKLDLTRRFPSPAGARNQPAKDNCAIGGPVAGVPHDPIRYNEERSGLSTVEVSVFNSHPKIHACSVLFWSAALTACSSEEEPSADPTWHQDIAPFVADHCGSCHNNEDDFTFSLTDYEGVKPLASWMLTKMLGDEYPPYIMPPFGALDTEECSPPAPWKDDPRPTEEELAMFSDWVDAGMPEGDSADAAPIDAPETRHLSGDKVETYTIAGVTISEEEEEDQYLCFPIELEQSGNSWITGLEVLRDNADIVHHAVVFSDPNGESSDLAGEDGSYPCFGSAGVTGSTVLFAWAPGADPFELGEDMGIQVPDGGQLVVQMHYHPSGEQESDATQLAVQYAESAPKRQASMFVYGGIFPDSATSQKWESPPFEIPANAANHEEIWVEDLEIPSGIDLRLFSVFPHMHLAGTEIRISIERDNGETCLSHNPAWDFEWQLTYLYDAPFEELPRLLPGDKIRVECRYNNSDSNPILSDYIDPEDIDNIEVGEDTFNEMCVAILGVTY